MRTFSKDEAELLNLMKQGFFSIVTREVMDQPGLSKQFLPPPIRPLHEHMPVAGRAVLVSEANTFEKLSSGNINPIMNKPFELTLEAPDGINIISQKSEKEVMLKAFERTHGKKLLEKAINEGLSTCEPYNKFGIL